MKKNITYNQYSLTTIKRLIAEGSAAAKIYSSLEELVRSTNYNFYEWEFVALGFKHPDFTPVIKEYYRIGEPIVDESDNTYKNSYNFADNCFEDGVSVVTTAWLHNLKSIFFGSADENFLQEKGIWKIKGFALPSVGGDDEILICPMDWAEKTEIKTREELEQAVITAGY